MASLQELLMCDGMISSFSSFMLSEHLMRWLSFNLCGISKIKTTDTCCKTQFNNSLQSNCDLTSTDTQTHSLIVISDILCVSCLAQYELVAEMQLLKWKF